MVHLLLKRGADTNTSSVPVAPLLLAVRSGDVDIVKQLLMAGANCSVVLSESVCVFIRPPSIIECMRCGLLRSMIP